MKHHAVLKIVTAIALALSLPIYAEDKPQDSGRPWCDVFSIDKADLSDVGKNPFFFLWPGYRLRLEHGKNSLIVAVLDETKVVDGVKTRVVEERETKDGKLVEVSRNFYAISKATGDVYYFGEEVDHYKDGKICGHEGSWLAGVNGAKFGLMMPGRPSVGDRYHQEIVPGAAMDRAEIMALKEEFTTPGGVFERCLKVRESSSQKSGTEDKLYALDVGLVKDGELVLTGVDCPLCKGKKDVPMRGQ